jgi:hypothetical protein
MLGGALTPTLGSQMADSCAADCDEAPAFGGLVVADLGYHLGSGAGLGLEIGAFRVTQALHGVRNVTLVASTDEPASVDDDLLMNAYFAGVFGELHRGTTLTWRATLALGATVIVVRDTERSGRIGSAPIQPIESEAERALYGHATAGIGLGYRLDRHWEIGAELRSTVLLALSNRPAWADAISGSSGSAVTFENEALLGSVIVLPHVVLGIRHEFH